MAKDYPRSYRVADQMQRELADLIRHQVRDPRVDALVTISSVEVNRDLTLARVFVTRIGGAPDDGAIEALNHAAGFLRGQIGARLRLRRAPELRFVHDELLDRGSRLTALIDEAVRSDRAEGEEARSDDPTDEGEPHG